MKIIPWETPTHSMVAEPDGISLYLKSMRFFCRAFLLKSSLWEPRPDLYPIAVSPLSTTRQGDETVTRFVLSAPGQWTGRTIGLNGEPETFTIRVLREDAGVGVWWKGAHQWYDLVLGMQSKFATREQLSRLSARRLLDLRRRCNRASLSYEDDGYVYVNGVNIPGSGGVWSASYRDIKAVLDTKPHVPRRHG
jgi:hypothetical protein